MPDDRVREQRPHKSTATEASSIQQQKKTSRRTSPIDVDTVVAKAGTPAASAIAVAPLDLGDQVVGVRTTKAFSLFNTDATSEAGVAMRIEGDPAVTIVSSPHRLRPSHEGTMDQLVLAFHPTTETEVNAVVTLSAIWHMGARPSEQVRLAVRGRAHHQGSPTHAERAATTTRQQEEERQRARDEAFKHDTQTKIDATYDPKTPRLRVEPAHIAKLEEKREKYQAAILDLYNMRREGVTKANGNIKDFKRQQPRAASPSLVETLAWAALDMVTAGIAGNVAKVAGAAFTSIASHTRISPAPIQPFHKAPMYGPSHETRSDVAPQLVLFVTEAVKEGVKKGGKEIGSRDGTDASPRNEQDVLADFIGAQAGAFMGHMHTYATKTSRFLTNSVLVNLMETNPDAGFAVFDGATAAVEAAADGALETQRQSTLQHWVQLIARSSMGTASGPKGSTVSDVSRANHTDAEHAANNSSKQPARVFDGLVDLRFTVSATQPREKATLVSAIVRGVRREVAKSLVDERGFLRRSVPVRAIADRGDNGEVMPLTVVRDETGAIQATDHMGLRGQTPTWLSRKAGLSPSEAAQHEGARILLEDELLTTPFDVHTGHKLKTDGES